MNFDTSIVFLISLYSEIKDDNHHSYNNWTFVNIS